MKKLCLISLLLINASLYSQNIGVGLGYCTYGAPLLRIGFDYKKVGLYTSITNQQYEYILDCSPDFKYIEHDNISFGATYQIHQSVRLFTGIGISTKFTHYNECSKRRVSTDKSLSAEFGCLYRLIDKSRFKVDVLISLSSFSAINSGIYLSYNLIQ